MNSTDGLQGKVNDIEEKFSIGIEIMKKSYIAGNKKLNKLSEKTVASIYVQT